MLSSLKTLADLLREVRSGSLWFAILFWLVFADAYLLWRFERSLPAVVQADPSVLVAAAGAGWMGELCIAVGSAAAAWFYLLPLVLVPLWRWGLFVVSLRVPEWLAAERRWPDARSGWVLLEATRRRAVLGNNPLLLAACGQRVVDARARSGRLGCVLGMLLFGALAAWLAGGATGPSLLGAGAARFEALPGWLMFLASAALVPGGMYLGSVLTDQGADFDHCIHLPELIELPDVLPKPPAYRAGRTSGPPDAPRP